MMALGPMLNRFLVGVMALDMPLQRDIGQGSSRHLGVIGAPALAIAPDLVGAVRALEHYDIGLSCHVDTPLNATRDNMSLL